MKPRLIDETKLHYRACLRQVVIEEAFCVRQIVGVCNSIIEVLYVQNLWYVKLVDTLVCARIVGDCGS